MLPHFSLTGKQYSSDCFLVQNNIGESQPACVAVYSDELFLQEEVMDIKRNTQPIQY